MIKIDSVGLKIFALGMIGVASLLTVNLPVPSKIAEQFSPLQIKFLILINPTILLLFATTAGVFANRIMNLRITNFQGFLQYNTVTLIDIAKISILGGAIAGVFLVVLNYFANPVADASKLQNIEMTLTARLLYGGVTEEILMRFGVMTSVAALIYKFVSKNSQTCIIFGLAVSTLLFALGHLPVLLAADPNPSLALVAYILFGNMIMGTFFGILYWRRGLDYAVIAHMVVHITMVALS